MAYDYIIEALRDDPDNSCRWDDDDVLAVIAHYDPALAKEIECSTSDARTPFFSSVEWAWIAVTLLCFLLCAYASWGRHAHM